MCYKGATIIADNHYLSSKKMRGVSLVCSLRKDASCFAKNNGGRGKASKKKEEQNKSIKNLRARVESPFGLLHNKFTILNGKFNESEEQLEFLVVFAAAVHNFNLE